MTVYVAMWGDGYGHKDVKGVFTTLSAAEQCDGANYVLEFELEGPTE